MRFQQFTSAPVLLFLYSEFSGHAAAIGLSQRLAMPAKKNQLILHYMANAKTSASLMEK